jgi:hypothetical protein
MSDGDVRVKFGSTDGGGSFIVQDSTDTMLFKITSKGQYIENYKVLTTSGTTITDIAPTSRFVLINLANATSYYDYCCKSWSCIKNICIDN